MRDNDLIKMFEHLLTKGREKMAKKLRKGIDEKVTHPQIILLHMIRCEGPCTVSSIASHVGVTPSAVTGLVDRLAELGYVTRSRSTDDRRLVYIGLTDLGEKLVDRFDENKMEFLMEMQSLLTDEEVKVIKRVLEKLEAMYFDKVD